MSLYRVLRSSTKLEAFTVEAASQAEAIDMCAALPGELIGASALYDAQTASPPKAKIGPQGFGFYLRRISGGTEAAQALLQRCREAKAEWVSFMVEASDGYTVSIEAIQAYAAVLSPEIDLWVWTFPGDARAASVAQSTAAANQALNYCMAIGAGGVMLDIEASYKGHPEALDALISTTKAGLSNNRTLGMVSYPIPSYHPTLAWDLFKKADWGSPMLYNTAGTQEGVDQSVSEWTKLLPTLVPSMATYDTTSPGTGAAQLNGDIQRILGGPPAAFDGAAMWSEQSTDSAQRAVMAQWSTRYGWWT